MIDIKLLQKDFDKVSAALIRKGVDASILDNLKEITLLAKSKRAQMESLTADQNKLSREFGRYKKEGLDIAPLQEQIATCKTSKQALEGVKSVPYNNEHQNILKRTIEKLKLIPPGGNFTSIPKDSPHYVKGMISHVYRRLHPDEPSKTIIAAGGGGTWGYHYSEPRPLTNRERARLFGYPDDFIFEGSIADVRRQIGNSVPPVGIYPISEHIYSYINSLDSYVHKS